MQGDSWYPRVAFPDYRPVNFFGCISFLGLSAPVRRMA
jgi:hypothetical protein